MKRFLNNKGFAMAETLIAAVSVISIFALLYNLIYPIIGDYKAAEKYDDLDSKYVAFYIKEMLETDPNPNFNVAKLLGNNTYIAYKTFAYYIDINGAEQPVEDNQLSNITNHLLYKNELCELLSSTSNVKNNQFACNQYVPNAKVTNIYLLKYNTVNFKNEVKDKTSFSRSLREYVKYMPSYSANSNKINSYRIIVEIEHDSYTTAGSKYYSYGTIEVTNR